MFQKIKSKKGPVGESIAKQYLISKGYNYILQNYRVPGGEIDLIFEKDGILVFVEVKTRTNNRFGTPEDSLTYWKQEFLRKTAVTYIYKNNLNVPWQLDMIAVEIINRGVPILRHYQNILSE